jgi:P27 family predicted phage terminase small subunit
MSAKTRGGLMGSGGHNRKSKNQKIIEGTFRKDRNPSNEPNPPKISDILKPPSHLGKYGKKMWKKLSKTLYEEGLLTVLDDQALELICEAYDQYRQAHEAVYYIRDAQGKRKRRSLGEYMEGRNSQTMPEYTAMNRHFNNIAKLLKEFGMTPVARNRINLPEKKEGVDPMEELLKDEV